MSVDTELLMAYVDGELTPAQAAQVATCCATSGDSVCGSPPMASRACLQSMAPLI